MNLNVRRALATFNLLLLLATLVLPAWAQPEAGATVYGTVTDQSTAEPLRKVLVVLQGSDLQAITDDQGRFRIEGIKPGKYTLYVSTIGYRLLKKEIQLVEGESTEVLFYLGQESTTINDVVRVTTPVFEEVEKAATSQIALNSSEIKNLAGVLIDDPLRSVQALPGVAAGDDFYSSYSVRGGGFQNNGLVVDGVLTHSLAHTIQGGEMTGSVTIMNGDLVESMALYSGVFSAKYGDRTASFLEVTTREGSRDRARARVAVSGSNAALIAEGPLDRTRQGGWILSGRKTYADYLVRRIGPESDLNMGFGDLQGKLAYDVSQRQHLMASFVWGHTYLGRNPANRGITSLIHGSNDSGLTNFSWSWAPNSRVLFESRAYFIGESFHNENKDGSTLGTGQYREWALRSDASVQLGSSHRLESGALFRFISDRLLDRHYNYSSKQFLDFDSTRAQYQQKATYAQDRWTLVPGKLSAIVGVRLETTGLTGQTRLDPRASLEWRLGTAHKLDAGWGIFSQFPEAPFVLGRNGNPALRAEVARHYVLGYERLLGEKSRLRVEGYDQEESGLIRSRDNLFRLVKGKVTPPDINFHYDNALRGHTRGFEVFIQRRSANRLAGWVSYGLESSKRRDLVTGETYSGDFEQRHTVNLYGTYRFSESWNLSAKVRFGSGFPYSGYLEKRGPDFYLSTERNRERGPLYNRIDFRINKAFYFTRSKLSLYVEVLNVLNRENLRYEQTFGVNASTLKVSLGRDTLLPILPTAGFVLEF